MQSKRMMDNQNVDTLSINNLNSIECIQTELPFNQNTLKDNSTIEYVPQDSRGPWKNINLVGNFNPFPHSRCQEVITFVSAYSDQYVVIKEISPSGIEHIHFWISNITKPIASVKQQLTRKFPTLKRVGRGGARKWELKPMNELIQLDYLFKDLTKDNYLERLFSNVFGYTGIWKTVKFHQDRYLKAKVKKDEGLDSKFLNYVYTNLDDSLLKDIPAIVDCYSLFAKQTKLKRVNKWSMLNALNFVLLRTDRLNLVQSWTDFAQSQISIHGSILH